MSTEIDVEALPPAARKLIGGKAPPHMRLMAAKGILPGVLPDGVVTVIVALLADPEAEIATTAAQTLARLPKPVLDGALAAELQEPVVSALAQLHGKDTEIVSKLMRMARMTGEIAAWVAEHGDEPMGELLSVNEQFLLANPVVIEKLYMNRRVRMSTADRLLELAIRNSLQLNIPSFKEIAEAIRIQLEGGQRSVSGDDLYREADELGQALSAVGDGELIVIDQDGEETVAVKALPLTALIAKMTITQKIRRAMLGTSSERMLLVRDKNRLVASAAVNSPMMKERDAEQVAASRSVIDDVLRSIAQNREFMRSYSIKLALVNNPRTPFTFTSRLVTQLRENDVKNLSKSKSVPQAVRTAAKQQISRKR